MVKKEVIAFDIGGTSTRAAIVVNNKIIRYISTKTPKTKEDFLKNIENLIDSLVSKNTAGIGIGIASPIKDGKVLNAPNLPLKNFELKGYLEKKYKVRVEVKNDAACVALAESLIGFRKKNFIIITLGTGIGGGIVINGKEYRGQGMGGEFGHIYIRGMHWEDLWKEMRMKMKKEFGQDTLVKDLVKMKNEKARELLNEATDFLAEGISSLISVFDPEAVLISGGLRESGESFLRNLNKSIKKYMFLPKKTKVTWTKTRNPGILGASLLID